MERSYGKDGQLVASYVVTPGVEGGEDEEGPPFVLTEEGKAALPALEGKGKKGPYSKNAKLLTGWRWRTRRHPLRPKHRISTDSFHARA